MSKPYDQIREERDRKRNNVSRAIPKEVRRTVTKFIAEHRDTNKNMFHDTLDTHIRYKFWRKDWQQGHLSFLDDEGEFLRLKALVAFCRRRGVRLEVNSVWTPFRRPHHNKMGDYSRKNPLCFRLYPDQ